MVAADTPDQLRLWRDGVVAGLPGGALADLWSQKTVLPLALPVVP